VYLVLENGDVYHWHISILDVPTAISTYFMNHPIPNNMNINSDGRSATFQVSDDSLGGGFPVPSLMYGCDWEVKFDSAGFSEDEYPRIIHDTATNTDSLLFKFKPGYCKTAEITLNFACEDEMGCPEEFALHIKNKDCPEPAVTDCEGLEIVEVENLFYFGTDTVFVPGHSFEIISTVGKQFSNVDVSYKVDDTVCSWSSFWFYDTVNNKLRLMMPPDIMHKEAVREVAFCVFFDDNTYCCDTLLVSFAHHFILSTIWLAPNPDVPGNNLSVTYELYTLPTDPTPLVINIYDQFGNYVDNIMDEEPTAVAGTKYYNVTSLLTGVYYITAQIGNEIEMRQFIKQ
jgi:hypothetical protein